jgi:NAD(P)-dependent dehydrogenase (short-subunit alcohol dehydrogenase family)
MPPSGADSERQDVTCIAERVPVHAVAMGTSPPAPHGPALLDGRTAIVVGSTHGIGRAVAEALAGHGASVVVNGRDGDAAADVVDALGRLGAASVAVVGSAADPQVAEALLDAAVAELGGVDALVTCAGTPEPSGSSILDVSSTEFAALMDAHLGTTFEPCRVVVPHLVAKGGGAVVTTSSHAFAGTYGGTGYPAGKGAVTSLTYALAAELAEHGVRVNAVCPGATTRLSTGDDYVAHVESLHARGLLDDATLAGSLDPGPPGHVAQLYAFLVSDLAAGITGQVLAGAGGYVGRFPRPEAELLTWRDHHSEPPWTPWELAEILGAGAP